MLVIVRKGPDTGIEAVHFVLTLAGMEVTSAAGHVAFAVVMSATTVTLLRYTQRVTLRALGVSARN